MSSQLCIVFAEATDGHKIKRSFGIYDKPGLPGCETQQRIIGTLKEGYNGLNDANISIDQILITMPAVDWLASR